MPIKIFAAPGDHRDDFRQVESQANEWIAETHPKVCGTNIAVNELPGKRESGQYMLTLVVLHEPADS